MRNLVRVMVLDSVVDFLLFLGKLVIVLITGAVSYFAFDGWIPEIKVGTRSSFSIVYDFCIRKRFPP